MKLGVVFSGGGIRGVVHIGVLKALEENNIKIDAIGGTSSGSFVAALYAMGYSSTYIYELFKRYSKSITNIEKSSIINGIGGYIVNKKISINGINDGKIIENLYNKFANRKNIYKLSDLKIPIVIPTIDIKEGKEYVFTNKVPDTCKINNKTKYITDVSIRYSRKSKQQFSCGFLPIRI